MASILTHPVVPLAIGLGAGLKRVPSRLLLLACLASILPDLDVLAFKFGIPYHSDYGHRGFSHSISFALLTGVLAAVFNTQLKAGRLTVFLVISLSTLSHGLLDAATNGGLGVAFFWPVDSGRYFLPWRPLQVSPIGVSPFFSEWGLRTLLSELRFVWLPALLLTALSMLVQRLRRVHNTRRHHTGPEEPGD